MEHVSTVSHGGSTDPQSVPTAEASLSSSPHPPHTISDRKEAQRYSRTKVAVGIVSTIVFFALTVGILISGVSPQVEWWARQISSNDYLVLLLFAAMLGVGEALVTFPLKYYSGYYLEHQFHLSNQMFGAWILEGIKGLAVGVLITTPILVAFYYCVRTFGDLWWLPIGALLFLVSVVLARLAPIVIFPLFYKFKALQESPLRQRILNLCGKVGVNVEGIYVFDLSKNTKKANAAFTGIGKSKRILLGDTLVANFTDDEIETVVAHELGHYSMSHVWRMMLLGTINSFLGLYLTALLYQKSLAWFGFASIDTIAALALLTLWLGVYSLVTGPITNMISRSHERAADRFALETTGKKEAFQNALVKLASINLADPEPHRLVEFFFHSHPSIAKRIAAAERSG